MELRAGRLSRLCSVGVFLLSGWGWQTEAAEEALPVWPAPGARFPEKPLEKSETASPERLGTTFWSKPPEVLSPYEPSWFDYQPIMWGGDARIKDEVVYCEALRKMFVRAGLCYSNDSPAGLGKARMPFYCTNLCNMLYLRNKPGGKVRDVFKKTRSKESCIRNPSLEDPKTDASERKRASDIAGRCARLKPLSYDLRDEGTYTVGSASPHDFDFSPVSLSCFRLWLKAKYGTLEALNAEWESAFKTWDEVQPLMTDEIQAREYPRIAKANFAPWADHRAYNDDTFSGAIARYRDTIHAQDPGAPVGISGTQMPSAWGGFDFWKLSQTVAWYEHYQCSGSRELMRSFLTAHMPLIASVHYKDKGGKAESIAQGLQRTWYLVFHGDTGGLVWPYNGHDTAKNILLDVEGEKIKLTADGEALKGIFQEMRGGIPCLLHHAEFESDPIGVLHSQASLRADWVFEVKRDGKDWYNRYSSYEGSHNFYASGREGYYKLLEDLGLQYACVSSAQVESGELLRRGFKLFIVPRGLALSKKELDGLKAYVEGGGVLVTDLLAGRMNENCRVWPQDPGPADALLGLQRSVFAFQEETNDELDGGYKGGFGKPIEVTLAEDFQGLKAGEKFALQGFQEPGLKAGSAKALAQTPQGPALLENKVGKGCCYTLNFDFPNYLEQRAAPKAEEATAAARRLMEAFVKRAGVAAPIRVARKDNDRYPVGLETFRYRLGGLSFYAVHPNGSVRIELDLSDSGAGVTEIKGGSLVLQLPAKGFVTEMRTKKALGNTDRVELTMMKNQPLILSVLPYEVKGLVVAEADKIVNGKLPLSLAIDAGTANEKRGDHVVHAELLDDKGEVVPESVVNIPLPKGVYQGTLDCSFVPGEGPWKLRLIDVASGRSFEAPVTK